MNTRKSKVVDKIRNPADTWLNGFVAQRITIQLKKITLICLNSNVANIRPAEVSLSNGCLTMLNCKGEESMRVGVEFRYQHPSL